MWGIISDRRPQQNLNGRAKFRNDTADRCCKDEGFVNNGPLRPHSWTQFGLLCPVCPQKRAYFGGRCDLLSAKPMAEIEAPVKQSLMDISIHSNKCFFKKLEHLVLHIQSDNRVTRARPGAKLICKNSATSLEIWFEMVSKSKLPSVIRYSSESMRLQKVLKN